MDYPSAVEFLAKRYGIPITLDKKEQAENARRERVLAMNKEAARFFHQKLFTPEGATGLRYLTEVRRLPMSLIRHFGLGFAPDGFGALTDHHLAGLHIRRSAGHLVRRLFGTGRLAGADHVTGFGLRPFPNGVGLGLGAQYSGNGFS